MKESISTVVMAYNEAPTLNQAVEEALDALESTGRPYELLIIDDGSTDGTSAMADELARDNRQVRAIHHESNQGLGGVYRTGFREVRNDYVLFVAADLQPILAVYFDRFLPLTEAHDVVLGYQIQRDDPWLSRFFSWAEKQVFQILYPGVPKIGGPCMFRRTILDEVTLASLEGEDRTWIVFWELIIRARRKGYRFASVPIERRPRAQGTSKGNTWRNAFGQFRAALRLRRLLR